MRRGGWEMEKDDGKGAGGELCRMECAGMHPLKACFLREAQIILSSSVKVKTHVSAVYTDRCLSTS